MQHSPTRQIMPVAKGIAAFHTKAEKAEEPFIEDTISENQACLLSSSASIVYVYTGQKGLYNVQCAKHS